MEQAMRDINCGGQQILLMVIWLALTRVETEGISYDRPVFYVTWTCLRGKSKGGTPLELFFVKEYVSFWAFLLGGANVEKWGDHQKKKFFIDNAVQALIPFKEVSMFEWKEEILFFEVKEKLMWKLFRIYWNLLCLMALQKRVGWF